MATTEIKPFTMQISWNNGAEGWQFPVLPEKINIKRDGAGKDYDIIKTGKIRTIEKPELTEISFESFFPAKKYPFVNEIFREDPRWIPQPHNFVNDILKWWDTGYPVRFIYIGSDAVNESSKLSLPMSIVSFERWEEGGSPGDIFYSLKLKEYVFYSAKRITAVQQDGQTVLRAEPPKRPDERVPPTTYTLKPGDSLIKVAKMQLGNSGRWREIQQLNGITDSEVRRLQVGRVLQLPPK
ncbi:LysM peptidoglycan-binding domain-containing protein [Paenibacillus naphthalenovorans]|uniref:LysM peptidoglycan-binding domain-containing protein n=1 Tax=Paenibacillus naphthalenovorans TaxID=162209 RepID=UPI00088EE6C7|nr:LysM domain-containing protein [Paenibacillus naphthalenovorans]SDJ92794.1 LysM domain-containing protein [Paenibacillus naphthalenovorans]